MSRKSECDKCGKRDYPPDLTRYKYREHFWEGEEVFELCSDCNAKFIDVLNAFMGWKRKEKLKP